MTSQSLPLATRANLHTLVSEADLSRMTDEELIQCLKAGRSEPMTQLFNRHYVIVRSIARKLLRNQEDVAGYCARLPWRLHDPLALASTDSGHVISGNSLGFLRRIQPLRGTRR